MVAGAAAATVATRRTLGRWQSNPDPLEGLPVRFPDGVQRFVELEDGAKISTVTVGTGPVVVCVHGLTGSRHDWGPLTPALLDAGYCLIAVEQRGHGESTAGTAGYGSARLGADLAEVFNELDIRAVALMGHSMGGMAAMAFAVDFPKEFKSRVSSLILLATAASLKVRGSGIGFRLSGLKIPDFLRPSNQRLRLGAGLGVFGEAPSIHMIDESIRSATQLPEAVRAAATSALGSHHVLDRIDQIDVPALIVGGTRDRLIRTSQVRQMADAIDGSELHMLNGAGHMLIWERHTDVTNLITNFLATNGDCPPALR